MNEKEFRQQVKEARQRGRARAASPTRAVRARYDRVRRRIEVELANGGVFAFPPSLAEGLANAAPKDLARVRIVGPGIGLRWDTLDVDLAMDGLLVGLFGSKPWVRELARRAGGGTSEAKARAARINGRKGGRPRKTQGSHSAR